VGKAFSYFDRHRRGRIAGLRGGLGCPRTVRLLIMHAGHRAVRGLMILLCVLAIAPFAIAALSQIVVLEARAGYAACKKALTRFRRQ
jgi:hypothetical protein